MKKNTIQARAIVIFSQNLSQWRRICGGGYDYAFDYITKEGGYGEYKDRT